MSKHTLAPWKIICHQDNPKIQNIGSSGAETVGDCFATVWSIGANNAQLIAAAPELLEALKATQAALKAAWDNGTLPASVIPAQIAQNNEAAINKAEGKA